MFNWIIDGVKRFESTVVLFPDNPPAPGRPSALYVLHPAHRIFGQRDLHLAFVQHHHGLQPRRPGCGSGTSDIAEQIKIQNKHGCPLPFNFFQYANFAGNGIVELGQNSHGSSMKPSSAAVVW